MDKVRVGIIGTSWWVDSMYLPALDQHPQAEVVALGGRSLAKAQALADTWNVPQAFTDIDALLDSGLDAVVIASTNSTHYDFTMWALERNLHVLCEKPLALTTAQAREMYQKAEALDVKTMAPFTYRFMPTMRYTKELLDSGYIGTPYHLNMRYYTGFARDHDYLWRFDMSEAGSGVLGDIGSHWLYLAQWFYGPVTALHCVLGHNVTRGPRPDGKPYQQADDSAMLLLEFGSGAQGSVHVSAVCYEDTSFGQRHYLEFHGSEGTIHTYTDWDVVQEVHGARAGDGPVKRLEIPEHIWGSARRDNVHNTYKDVFRKQDHMTRAFINAIINDTPCEPTFADGLYVQRLLEAAEESAKIQKRVVI